MAAHGASPGTTVSFWRLLLDALTGAKARWDPECDEDVLYLRRHAAVATATTRRLRGEAAFPLARSTRSRTGDDHDAE